MGFRHHLLAVVGVVLPKCGIGLGLGLAHRVSTYHNVDLRGLSFIISVICMCRLWQENMLRKAKGLLRTLFHIDAIKGRMVVQIKVWWQNWLAKFYYLDIGEQYNVQHQKGHFFTLKVGSLLYTLK